MLLLTAEHIPPRRAFNERAVILQRVSEASIHAGHIDWEDGPLLENGYQANSLCSKCNNRAGDVFAPSYIEFTKQVAAAVTSPLQLTTVRLERVRNPQLILRQILMQFVTSNGASFVEANSWIRQILHTRHPSALPSNVHLYIFATQDRTMRTSGISGRMLVNQNRYQIVSEFSCWPLGTLLSFTPLDDEPVMPIRDWVEIQFKSKKLLSFDLPVNEIASPYPVDFRGPDSILRGVTAQATKLPSESLVREMMLAVNHVRGDHDNNSRILTAHPSYKNLISK